MCPSSEPARAQAIVFPGRGPNAGFYFRIKAANGEILAQSESYVSAGNALRAARTLLTIAATIRSQDIIVETK